MREVYPPPIPSFLQSNFQSIDDFVAILIPENFLDFRSGFCFDFKFDLPNLLMLLLLCSEELHFVRCHIN